MTATLEERLVHRLRESGRTLACAESLTGGLFGGRLTRVPGTADVFLGGVISYRDAVKEKLLGVSASMLDKVGGVSEEVALEMARGCRRALGADLAVSLTGFAGPRVPEGMPRGLVYVAIAHEGAATAQEFRFDGDRHAVREQSVDAALQMLLDALEMLGSAPARRR